MARYWIVRRYGKYITNNVTYGDSKEALSLYDKACKYEENKARKFGNDPCPIALFLYDPSARFNKKINSFETMVYYSQRPLPKWPGVRYRNVKVEPKKKASDTNAFGLDLYLK